MMYMDMMIIICYDADASEMAGREGHDWWEGKGAVACVGYHVIARCLLMQPRRYRWRKSERGQRRDSWKAGCSRAFSEAMSAATG